MIWFAYRTAPQKELLAERILRSRGLPCLVPVETKWRKIGMTRKKKPRDNPMMIGYIFVGLERAEYWPALFIFKGLIQSVVGSSLGVPAKFSADQIDRLRLLSGKRVEHIRSVDTHRAFRPGDHVAMFGGIEARIEEIHGDKARIVFELLGKVQVQEVPVDRLEVA